MTSSEASAPEPGGELDVLRFFERLAVTVGAVGALPAKDGCVLFVFKRASRQWRVFWSPVERPGGIRVRGLTGCLIAQGQATPDDVRVLGEKLAKACDASARERSDPLAVLPRPKAPFELRSSLFANHVLPLLAPARTRWGELRLDAVREGDTWLELRFASASEQVVMEFRPRSLLTDPDPTGAPFHLQTIYDSRAPAEAKTVRGALENYVSYALRRAFPPGLSFRVREQEGAEYVQDFYDETHPNSFFLGIEHRRVSCQHTISSVLEADRGVAFVLHVTAECASHYAWIQSSAPYGHLHTRPAVLPMTYPTKPTQFVEVGEMDAVMGSEDELRARLKRVTQDPETRIVVTASTCISHLLNIPVEAILDEEAGTSGLPTSFLEFVVDDTARPGQVWIDLLKVADRDVVIAPRTVNLVGYAAMDSDLMREADAILAAGGVTVLNWIVPSFRTGSARRFFEATCTCVSTAEIVHDEFRDARESLSGIAFADIAPPFGLAGATRFYREVLSRAGSASLDCVDAARELVTESWRLWHARARKHCIAMLVHPNELSCLLEPSKLHGLDLIPTLAEMGFRIAVVCAPGRESAGAERSASALLDAFAHLAGSDPCLSVTTTDEDGIDALDAVRASLVFSEFPSDLRVLAKGKIPIGTTDFEPGFEGALRTLVKLTRLAECRFHAALEHAIRPRTPCD